MKQVRYAPEAVKIIRSLDGSIKQRIKAKIESLAEGKVHGLHLRSPLQNYQKLRVGDYRILFQEKDAGATIYIAHIQHRSKVYKGHQQTK